MDSVAAVQHAATGGELSLHPLTVSGEPKAGLLGILRQLRVRFGVQMCGCSYAHAHRNTRLPTSWIQFCASYGCDFRVCAWA